MEGFSLQHELNIFLPRFMTYENNNKISRFASEIEAAKTIYIAGIGSSKTLAEYFSHRLNQLDKAAVYVYEASLLDLLPNLTNRATLVIYISISSETEPLVNSAFKVTHTGAKLLSLTNVRSSRLGRLSH